VLLFIVQTALIARRRAGVHRSLGVAGAALAAAMVVAATMLSLATAARGSSPPGMEPLPFLIIPLFDILLFASNGKAVRFDESAVRAMGRTATGVRGIRLAEGESVVSLIVADPADSAEEFEGDDEAVAIDGIEQPEAERAGEPDAYVLTATVNGYGKRTRLAEYPRKGRGTQGVIGIQTTERNGALVAAVLLSREDEVLLISDGGTLVRTRAAEVSVVSRNTQGVTLIRLGEGERLQAIERVDGSIGDDEDVDGAEADADGDVETVEPASE
jgi:DNA gyrase subunit A